jgi:hypothetical protein
MTDKQIQDLNEAPASTTYSITSKNGFNILFTIRDTTGMGLLEKMEIIEKELLKDGYKPQVRQVFGQKKEVEYVEGRLCPKCQGKLKVVHAKSGMTYWSCENGHYDYTTKTRSGCDYLTTPEKYGVVKTSNPYDQTPIPVENY